MESNNPYQWFKRIREFILGRARNPFDRRVFHHISLVAFFAWVGLGADGLSSSCYGPAEAFEALGQYKHLAIFVALATALTVWVISSSYTQVIEQFPTGGGGYLVASKLLSPSLGMVSGCALLMDYVLTITISIASGVDALFSFFPAAMYPYKLPFAVMCLLLLSLLNLRGVKESVGPLVPIFALFVLTHAAIILVTVFTKVATLPTVVQVTVQEVNTAHSNLGYLGLFWLFLVAYSMGSGTYTGIEAVSNGLPILREPRVETGKKTMRYMTISLAIAVVGLMLAYLLYDVEPVAGKTLNAVLVEKFTAKWPAPWGQVFILVTMSSAACILFVAAQAGFLGGPRVLVNMALDRWFPHKFATFSDRLVTQNGVLMMAVAALAALLLTGGSVKLLVVLYSINVFITFVLSQLGMVQHWWLERRNHHAWIKGMTINGIGLVLCTFILLAVTAVKFHEGGWITLFVTGSLVVAVTFIRRHYRHTSKLLRRLDGLVKAAENDPTVKSPPETGDPNAKTAVMLVNGFNGLGMHTLLNIQRLFPNLYQNFIFVQIGVLDAGNFKGVEEIEKLRQYTNAEVLRYVRYIQKQGLYAEGFTALGTDVVEEVAKLSPSILEKYPQAVFFGGQLVFPFETFFTRWLHNFTVFALQRRFYSLGIPVVVLPIRV